MADGEENKKKGWTFWKILIGIIVAALVLTLLWKLFTWIFGLKKRVRRQPIKAPKKSTQKSEPIISNLTAENNSEKIDFEHPDDGLRWVLFGARMLVVIGIIIYNYVLYLNWNKVSFDWNKQLNFNEALLLSYSLIAFILFGSVNKFSEAMKEMIRSSLSWVKMKF